MNGLGSHRDREQVSSYQCLFFVVVQLTTPDFRKTEQLPATAVAIKAYATSIAKMLPNFEEPNKLVIGLLLMNWLGYQCSGSLAMTSCPPKEITLHINFQMHFTSHRYFHSSTASPSGSWHPMQVPTFSGNLSHFAFAND